MKNTSPYHISDKDMTTSSTIFDQFVGRWLYSPYILVLLFVGFGAALAAYVTAAAMLNNQDLLLLAAALAIGAFITILTRSLEKVLLSVIIVDTVFPIDKYYFYSPELDAISGIPGLGISISGILIIGLYILWIVRLTRRTQSLRNGLLLSALPSCIYLLTIIISMRVAQNMSFTIFEAMTIGQVTLLFVYLVDALRSENDVKFIMTILMTVILIHSLLMIYLYVTRTEIIFGVLRARVDVGETIARVGGTFGGPNGAGGFLSLTLLPVIGMIFSKIQKKLRILATVTLVAGLVALITTFSRGAWLGFFTFSVVFSIIAIKYGWIKIQSLFVMGFPVLAVAIAFGKNIIRRITQSDTSAIYSRFPLNDIAFQMIQDNPIFGIGGNNFGLVVRYYSSQLGGIWLRVVHNKYLLVWSETGIFGLLAFLGFLGTTLLRGWSYVQRKQVLSPLALGILCGISAQMLHMTVDIFNTRNQLQALWIMSSIAIAMSLMESEDA